LRIAGGSGTAAHPADQFVAGNLVLIGERPELVQGYRSGSTRAASSAAWV
jgi:hypothetical protein